MRINIEIVKREGVSRNEESMCRFSFWVIALV